MIAPAILFDPEDEDYCLVDGRRVRRWHKVARDAGLVEPIPDVAYEKFVNAKHRGRQVDEATQYIMRGEPFDPQGLADESVPYVQAFLDWWLEKRPDLPFSVQQPLYNAELDYCTTPDFHTSVSVFDIKTSSQCSRLWGLQLAAQGLACGGDWVTRRIVWLRPKMKIEKVKLLCSPRASVFTVYDFDVVREACRGEYDGPAITAWKALR